MEWKIAGQIANADKVYETLENLRADGPTAIILIGAEGAVRSSIVSLLWNNLDRITTIHQYGGAQYDLFKGYFVVEHSPDLATVDPEYRARLVQNLRNDGAEYVVTLWSKYPDEDGWTSNSGRAIDRILRDNPPTEDETDLLIEAEESPRGR